MGQANKCETKVGACLPDQRDGREAGVAAGEGTLGSTVGNIIRTGWWVPSAQSFLSKAVESIESIWKLVARVQFSFN